MLCSILGKGIDEASSSNGSKLPEGIESHSDGDHIPPQPNKHQDTSKQSNARKSVNSCALVCMEG